jgi:hypothetical protein
MVDHGATLLWLGMIVSRIAHPFDDAHDAFLATWLSHDVSERV